MPKNWCFWTVVLEKTLESPLDCEKIQPVHPKGNQSWVFIERIDAEAPILWPPDVKSWLTGKDPNGGKDWRQEEKGTTENEMVGMASLTPRTWVWASSWSWWRTGKPGVLQSMGSQRVRHDWATELTYVTGPDQWVVSKNYMSLSKVKAFKCQSGPSKSFLSLCSSNQQVQIGGHSLACIPVQFSSVAQSCPTLVDPMDCSTPGLPVHHQLPELTQTHVHWVSDAIQPSHPLLSPSPPAFNLSQHQGQMSQFSASGGQSIGVSASTSVLPMNTQDWSPLRWTGWISFHPMVGRNRTEFWVDSWWTFKMNKINLCV